MDTQHFIAIIMAVVASSGFWQFLQHWWDRKYHKRTKLEDAVMCILHDRVYFLCRSYLGKSSIAHDDYDNLSKLFQAYSDLGGNGTAQRLMKEVEKLSITDE